MEVFRHVLRSLLRAEEESAETAGILPVRLGSGERGGEQQLGTIMAEKGRICWASAPRTSSRLSDLLLEVSGISRDQIERVFRFCRRTGKPLGEHLVSLGIVTREQLREALLCHNLSVLYALGKQLREPGPSPGAFRESQERTYNPMITFSALELVLEMIRRDPELGVTMGSPPATFERWAPKVTESICFLETSWEDLPGVPIRASGDIEMSLRDALQLFRLCRGMAERPNLPGTGSHPFTAVVRNEDHAWLTARLAPHLCLYRADSAAELRSIISGMRKETEGSGGE